ncbi:MAG: beta-ketoacyl-ACP synthase II [Chloroflexota bacterium]
MRERVVITGLGCISPLGNDVDTTWSNILNGESGISQITNFDASEYKTQIGAEVKGFDGAAIFGVKDTRRMDRYAQYGVAAGLEALEDSGLNISNGNRERIGAVIGTGVGGISTIYSQTLLLEERGPSRVSPFMIPMMLPDTVGGMLAIRLGIQGTNFAVVTACATGTNSIGEAAEVIRRGQADVMFTGGAEAAIIPVTIAGMASMTAMSTRNHEPQRASRPFDKERDGFVMGEGAAVLTLESLEHAQNRGARIYAEVSGYGSTNDAFHITAPSDKGVGATKCMQMALNDAELSPKDIGYINAHGTSTYLNDKNETAAIKTVFGKEAYNTPISSTKSMMGHMMGATGAIETIFCVKTIQDGVMPPTINYENPDPECDLDYIPNENRKAEVNHTMSNSFGFGGHNATIVLSKYDKEIA